MVKVGGKKKNFFLRAVLLLTAIYTVVSVISLQLRISEAKERLALLQEQLARQETENSLLDDLLEADRIQQAEQTARDKLGLVYPDERVYEDIS